MSASRPLTSFGVRDLLQDLFGRNGTSATAQSLNAKKPKRKPVTLILSLHRHVLRFLPGYHFLSNKSVSAFNHTTRQSHMRPSHLTVLACTQPSKKSTQRSNYSSRNGHSSFNSPHQRRILIVQCWGGVPISSRVTNQRFWHFVSQQVI
jgi:hypothetical protein